MSTATAIEPRQSTASYVAPFVAFLGFLAIQSYNPLPQNIEFVVRVLAMGAILWFFSRHVVDLRVHFPLASIGIGIAVFVIWVAPDALIPGYRTHWLFQNAITGSAKGSVAPTAINDPLLLAFRSIRAVIIVPIVEELFWRAWLMRWLIDRDFWKLPLGAYLPSAFWITAVLFASEHGPYWEVGLIAGVAYNWWMVRTKSLGDLILAHAITNGLLCAYVIATHKWEYWL